MGLYYLLRGAILLVLGLLIYAQTFQYGFVFDDYIFIVNNPFIKNFHNIHLMWQAFPVTRLVGMYSFAFNYYFNQLHPAGYHVFNFVVHIIAAFLVWALADLLFRLAKAPDGYLTKESSFIIALLFLVHPCQTQAVTYITQRFESMATVFYLATLYVYLRARLAVDIKNKMRLFGLATLFTILGIMTKEVMITVPVMILAAEWIFFPGKDKKRLVTIILIAAGGLGLLIFKMVHTGLDVFLSSHLSESHDGDVLTPLRYLLTQMRVFLTFLRLLVFPVHQNLDYDYPASIDLFHPPLTFLGFAVITGFIFTIIKWRQRFPLIAFGLSWMLITFSINLVPRNNVIFEHKLYLISFGFFLSVVAALSFVVRQRRVFIGIFVFLIMTLAFLSFERNKVWADELTLWKNAIQEAPNKARVNSNLGRIYGSKGEYDQAIKYLSRAIVLYPDNITYENRGIIYSQMGKTSQALDDLNKSIAMDPNYFSTYVKRSWVYQTQHNYQAALNDLAQAIKLEPHFTDGYVERGMLWMSLGRNQDAFKDFQTALSIDPFNYEVLLRQGAVCLALEKYDLALECFNKALSIEPSSGEAAAYKIYCLHQLGRR